MRPHHRSIVGAAGVLALVLASVAGFARADDAPAAAPAPAVDRKGITTPSTDDLAKGDPGGALTGSAADIVMADPKASEVAG